MKTYFASAERADEWQLSQNIQAISEDSIVKALVQASNSLFAILNCQRQVLALNQSFLQLMGIEDVSEALGLRLGEYVKCIHAHEMPGGCGTSSYCSTCGSVIATMAAIAGEEPKERHCALTVLRDGKEAELFFQVRCGPVIVQGNKFILVFLQDLSLQQQRANLEKVFFHDISNLLVGLNYLNQHLNVADPPAVKIFQKQFERLSQEFCLQKALVFSLSQVYKPLYRKIQLDHLLLDLKRLFIISPLVKERGICIEIQEIPKGAFLVSDQRLLQRVVENMMTNAMEATERGGRIRVFVEQEANANTFKVWNEKPIPEEIARRIFQRNFSTKSEPGHGLGTYSMKFFGEKILGGKVEFTSSVSGGTVFSLKLMHLTEALPA